MTTCVVGLGKVGLPIAVQAASKDEAVVGADSSSEVVSLVNGGVTPFPGEAHLAKRLAAVVDDRRLVATTDTRAGVAMADAVIVVVPLMTGAADAADFAAVDSATADIAAGLQPGTLVSYETTLPVGTTRTRFARMLAQGSGLAPGRDFSLVHSPERVFSGRIFSDLARYPKLVGGIDRASTEHGRRFYESILDFDDRPDLNRANGVWAMSSAEAAEMAKLAETTYRDVNIALANEFAVMAERRGINVGEVIEASNSQPFSHIHRPGVAVGGHCIPVYPRFYLSGHPEADLVRTARDVNEAVPERVVAQVARSLGGDLHNSRVLILGAAYRGGVKEAARSGVFALDDEVRRRGGSAVVSDPLYSGQEIAGLGLKPWAGDEVDAVIVQADHAEYRSLSPGDFPGASVLFDGRAIVDLTAWSEAGVETFVIGQGETTP